MKKSEESSKFTWADRDQSRFYCSQQRTQEGNPLIDPVKSRWFNTLAFRQAVAYSINRQSIINNIYRGLGVPINSPIIPSPYIFRLSRV